MAAMNATAGLATSKTRPGGDGTTVRTEALGAPRLAPIEEPHGVRLRLAYWGIRRGLGKVITPAKVLYARVPESIPVVRSMQKFQQKGVKLEPGLQILVTDLASRINGCAFCEDIGRAVALRRRMGLEEKLDALLNYRTDPLFSPRERAALAYVEETTRHKRVSDGTFAELRAQFTEREIVEITLLNAIENLYNLTNLPLGIGSDGLCALARPKDGHGGPG